MASGWWRVRDFRLSSVLSVCSVVNPSVGGFDADAEEGFGGVVVFAEFGEGMDGFGVVSGGDDGLGDGEGPGGEVLAGLGVGVEAGV